LKKKTKIEDLVLPQIINIDDETEMKIPEIPEDVNVFVPTEKLQKIELTEVHTVTHPFQEITDESKKEIEQFFAIDQKNLPKSMKAHFEFPHQQSVSSVAFNKSESKFFTATKGVVNIWNLETLVKKPMGQMKCLNDGYIRACILSDDEKLLLTCGETKEITLWDIESSTPKIKHTMETNVPFHYSAVFHNDSQHCFTSTSDGKIAFWDFKSKSVQYTLSGHSDCVSSIKMCGDNYLLSAALDKTVRLWDCRMRKETDIFEFENRIFSFDYFPETSLGIVGLEDGTISAFSSKDFGVYNIHQHTKGSIFIY
jgi:WD40 repeat protein